MHIQDKENDDNPAPSQLALEIPESASATAAAVATSATSATSTESAASTTAQQRNGEKSLIGKVKDKIKGKTSPTSSRDNDGTEIELGSCSSSASTRRITSVYVSQEQQLLLLELLKHFRMLLPETHRPKVRNSRSHPYSESDQRYFFGYELVETIMNSRIISTNRMEACDIAESMLMLQLVIMRPCKIKHTMFTLHGPKHHELVYNDDKTRYYFIENAVLQDPTSYNYHLMTKYTQYRYVPRVSRLIDNLFYKDVFDLSYKIPMSSKPKGIVDRVFHYSEYRQHKMLNEAADIDSPDILKVRTRTGTFHIETADETIAQAIPEDLAAVPMDYTAMVISHYSDMPLDFRVLKWTRNIPLLTFSIVLSTSALSMQWRNMSQLYYTPALIYKIIICFAALLWVLAVALQAASVVLHRDKWKKDIHDEIQVTLWCIVAMSLFQISDVNYEFAKHMTQVLFWIAFSIQCASMVMLYVQLVAKVRAKLPLRLAPCFFYNGSGFIIGSMVATKLGHTTFAWVIWAFGTIYVSLAEIMLLINYKIFGLLPGDHIPTQMVLVAFPSVCFVGVSNILGHLTIATRLIYGLIFANVLLAVTVMTIMYRRTRKIRKKFHLGWWAFCFPSISFGSAALTYYRYTPYLSCKIFSIAIVSISNALFALVTILTLYHLVRRNLFIPSRARVPV
ncbi:hypothetical protein SAMD00019534_084220 [Acytostelium subglobosum LB1]|uniref:hypothetical protein n=1 Tax=Acytostelium subglobosum LB1 TaxID=1410327 RepID=UPI0006450DFE|nr:hypothetical protein SAMD00019534_084220 [Acytostelium subglobosum LB1]GAM25247.1 hypothetical protein SAMD00019534_084220 [Acytostelium subglobosum LB1]|eukprot:XP_012751767.1 hypothetical protein SAMD00019534_084220 [Acytostelium subglobosum LB1]